MVELDLKHYKGEDLYSDGPVENEIIDYIKNNKEEDFENIFKKDMRWPVFYHLSPLRKNVLDWYPFEKESKILEIGAGMGAITGVLLEKASLVTCVELSKNRATAIQNRYKDANNLEIIVANLNDIKIEEKYDYITLIGVLEYANSFTDSKNPYEDFLKKIKKYLKPNGKILIAIENKFGLKYWAGSKEDHTRRKYDSMKGYKDISFVKTFGKNDLIKIFKSAGFENSKFYYPLPDYKFPNIIFTDKYLPNKESFYRYKNYEIEEEFLNFHENEIYREIIKENPEMFSFFCNSYIIEVSNTELTNEIKHVSYNNTRKKEYRLCTKITDENVIKTPLISSKKHFENIKKNIDKLQKQNINLIDSYNEENIISKYIEEAKSLESLLVEKLTKNDIDSFYEELNKYNSFLTERSIKIESKNNTFYNEFTEIDITEEQIKKQNYLEDGFTDLIFRNIFIKNNKYLIFDQEWYLKNISTEFIMYKSIKLLFEFNYISEDLIKLDDVLKKYSLTEFKQIFDRTEKKIQQKISNKEVDEFFDKNKKYVDEIEFYKQKSQTLENELTQNKIELEEIHKLRMWPTIKKYINFRKKIK